MRHHLMEEPYAVIPPVRICAGYLRYFIETSVKYGESTATAILLSIRAKTPGHSAPVKVGVKQGVQVPDIERSSELR